MNHINISSAFYSIPSPNFNSSHQSSQSDLILFPNLHIINIDHLDPPPPYSAIQEPPPYQIFEDLVLAEIFRALFHYPDFHPLLSPFYSSTSSQFPDSYFSHLFSFPPQYDSSSAIANRNEHGWHEYSTIIRIRDRQSTQRVSFVRPRRHC